MSDPKKPTPIELYQEGMINASNAIDILSHLQAPGYATPQYLRHYIARHANAAIYSAINTVISVASEMPLPEEGAMDSITQTASVCMDVFSMLLNRWTAGARPIGLEPLTEPNEEVEATKSKAMGEVDVENIFMRWPENKGMRRTEFLELLKPVAVDLADYILGAISQSAKAPETGTVLAPEVTETITNEDMHKVLHNALLKIAINSLNALSSFQLALVEKGRQTGWEDLEEGMAYELF